MQDEDFEYVGFWARFGAAIIDSIIMMIFIMPALFSIYGWAYLTDDDKPFIAGPADFLLSYVLPAVATILFWLYKQGTPGKMAVSARVVDAKTGTTLTVVQSIGRYLAYYVSMLPLFLGFIGVGFDPRKQGWHDKLAGTVVIRPKHRGTEPVKFED